MFIKKLENQVKKDKKLLNESLQDIKKIVWPNLNVQDIVMFMRFSPAWRPDLEQAEIEVSLTKKLYDECVKKTAEAFENANRLDIMDKCVKITPVQAQSSESKIKFSGDKELISQFKRVGANIKLDKAISDINDGEISVGGSDEQQKKAFTLFSAMSADKSLAAELTKLSTDAVGLMQRMKDKSLTPDQKKQVISDMKSIGATLKSKLDDTVKIDLTPEQQAEFDRLRLQNTGPVKYRISGYIPAVCCAYVAAYSAITGHRMQTKWLLEEPNVQTESFQAIDGLRTELHDMGVKDAAEFFFNNVKLTGDADEQTRWIIKICNDELQRSTPQARQALQKNIDFEENKLRGDLSSEEREKAQRALAEYRRELDRPIFTSASELRNYMKRHSVGFLTRYYIKKLNDKRDNINNVKLKISKLKNMQQKLAAGEKALADEKDENEKAKIRDIIRKTRQDIQQLASAVPSDKNGNIEFDEESEKKKLPPDLMTFKSLDALVDKVSSAIKGSGVTISTEVVDPDLKTPCAQRRMKLFAAAERRGAEIYKCKDWVIAHLPTAHAAQPFGRYRPKVDSNGQIIPECNLETWEGITPQNKRLRDSEQGQYIKDSMFSQAWETIWCTAGWGHPDRRQWDNEVGPGNMFSNYGSKDGLIAFMDCSTGYLYQYGEGSLLDECDKKGGILNDAGTINKLVIKFPSLLVALNKSGFIKYIPDLKQTDPTTILEGLIRQGKITDGGSAIIASHDDFIQIKPVINFIDEIKIAINHTNTIFHSIKSDSTNSIDKSKIISLPIIDLGGVTDASHLFSRIVVSNETLKFKNTKQIVNARSMFEDLRFEAPSAEITGLDTRNVKFADSMFANCKNTQFRGVHIPELDFGQCESMENAFYGSGITSINFKNNHDKVRNASDAFVDCFMLENMPNVLFKSIFSKDRLISDAHSDYSDIFRGCSKLIKKYRQLKSSGGAGDKFDDRIDDIRAFYEDTKRIKPMMDSRGYIIVKNSNDAKLCAKFLSHRDVKGIVIDKSAVSEGLFSDLTLKIKSLDLNGIELANSMFIDCVIDEFGEIIGSENVKNATGMFTHTKCNIYPPIRFPKCKTVNVFLNALSPYDIPDIQYSQNIKEIPKCGINELDDINGIAQGVGMYMFGDQCNAWFKTHGIIRVVQAMYTNLLTNMKDHIMQNLRKDSRDFIIIDENTTPTMVNLALQSKPKGFVFDPEYVKSLNEKTPDNAMNDKEGSVFFECSADTMPIIDFNGIKNCSCFFRKCQVGTFAGFLNFGSVINADNMFESANIGRMPALDLQNIRTASSMFAQATVNEFGSKLALPNAQVTSNMFFGTLTRTFPFGDNIDLPNAVNVQAMFLNFNVHIPRINKISMPKCRTAEQMFRGCRVEYVGQIEMSTVNADSMFKNTGLVFIGDISAPNAVSADNMFAMCQQLKRIGVVKMPRTAGAIEMFSGCTSLGAVCQIAISPNAVCDGMFKNTMLGRRVYGENGERLIARIRLLNM